MRRNTGTVYVRSQNINICRVTKIFRKNIYTFSRNSIIVCKKNIQFIQGFPPRRQDSLRNMKF